MALPARSLETAVEVQFPSEAYRWLALHACLCGGAWALERQSLLKQEETEVGTRMTDRLEVRCDTCGRAEAFFFVVQYEGRLGDEA